MLTELFDLVQKQISHNVGPEFANWADRSVANSILLNFFLPKFISHFGPNFSRFADCGAYMGGTALRYDQMLSINIPKSHDYIASITAYEPIPENLKGLTRATRHKPRIIVRPVAVSDYTGVAQFIIPFRRINKSSQVGYLLPDTTHPPSSRESITVNVVRLEDESESGFDFVKMDLQGGERAALKGMGKHFLRTKLIYAEHQLLGHPDKQPLTLLQESGFRCFIDSIQFRFSDTATRIPIDLLHDGGIVTDCVKIDNNNNVRLIFKGHINHHHNLLQKNGEFPDDYTHALKEAGVHYLQTDILAVNPSIMPDAVAMVERQDKRTHGVISPQNKATDTQNGQDMKCPSAEKQFIANEENQMKIRIPEELVLSSGWSEVTDRFIEKVEEWRFFISKLYGDKPLHWLELGSYEGRSTVVTVLNFLQHPESKLVAIDDWHYGESEVAYDKNIEVSGCKDKIKKIKSDWFPALKKISGLFDVIFVDADHRVTSVVTQMAMLWQHLKKDGLMIVDDYEYQASHEAKPLREGIDAFLDLWGGEYKLLRKGNQVILQKT